jgi:ABC-type multidrug transport system fused ATPase/permease subunit
MQIQDLPYADPGVPDTRSGPRFLLWLGRNQLGGQLKSLSWGLLQLFSISALPYLVGSAVQAVVDRDGDRLALAAGLTALCGLATALGDTMLHRTGITNWITAAARVQQLLARQAAHLGSSLTRQVAAGEVVAVSTGDVEKIGWFVEALSRFLASVVAVLAICVGLLVYRPELGIIVAAGVPVLAFAVLPLLPPATRRADQQRTKAGRATELASDTVAGLRVLRGIGGEELFLDRYRHASQEVRRAAVRSARMWSLISMVQVLLPGVLLIVVVWHGVSLVREGRISVGELVTVYSTITLLSVPLRQFEEIAMAYSFSRPSARRAARVLALQRATDTGGSRAGAPPTGDLWDPATDLRAPAGRLTAVVCGDPDAAGRLAERLGGHTPSERTGDGERPPSSRISDVPLDELPLATARATVLVQDKDPVLLSGTLHELFDVPASGAIAPEQALDAAQCSDVLSALLQGAPGAEDPMQAHITERGRSLSGGQRQRLALARSLAADPEVLVLDEPTSAVDSHTEARIARGLRRLRAGRTTVVFTSSPLLLDQADQVVLVQKGTALASGTHRELLTTEPRYRAVVTREPESDGAPAHTEEASANDTPSRSGSPEHRGTTTPRPGPGSPRPEPGSQPYGDAHADGRPVAQEPENPDSLRTRGAPDRLTDDALASMDEELADMEETA